MADDGERKRVREQWLALNRKYEASGMTRKEFCAQEKISLPTFDNWRGTFRRKGLAQDVPRHKPKRRKTKPHKQPTPRTTNQPNALVPVVITQPAEVRQTIQITTSKGHTVSIPVSVCPALLKEVFKSLGDL